jgi:hypothetical protein
VRLEELHVGFEILTAVVMKISYFWDLTPFNPLKTNRRFEGIYRLHIHGPKTSRKILQYESRWQAEVLP